MYHLNLTLDPAGKKPMYEQLYRFLADEIRSGVIGSGERLPSKRALCAQLGVSRSTVEAACDLLLAEGYAVSRPRSGFFAADVLTQTAPTEQPARKPAPPEPSALFRKNILRSRSRKTKLSPPCGSWSAANPGRKQSLPDCPVPWRKRWKDPIGSWRKTCCVNRDICCLKAMRFSGF